MTDRLIIRPAEARDSASWTEMWKGYNDFYGVSLSDQVTAATWARILDPTSPIQALLATDGALFEATIPAQEAATMRSRHVIGVDGKNACS